MSRDLIEEFDHVYLDFKRALSSGNRMQASATYVQLRDVYARLSSSDASHDDKVRCYNSVKDAYSALSGKRLKTRLWPAFVPFALLIVSELFLTFLSDFVTWSIRVVALLTVIFIASYEIVKVWRKNTLDRKIYKESSWVDKSFTDIENYLAKVDRDIVGAVTILLIFGLITSQVGTIVYDKPGLSFAGIVPETNIVMVPHDGFSSELPVALKCDFSNSLGIDKISLFESSSGVFMAHERVVSSTEASLSHVVSSASDSFDWYCSAESSSGSISESEVYTVFLDGDLTISSPSSTGIYSSPIPLAYVTAADSCSLVVNDDLGSMIDLPGCSGYSLDLPDGSHKIKLFAFSGSTVFESERIFTVSN